MNGNYLMCMRKTKWTDIKIFNKSDCLKIPKQEMALRDWLNLSEFGGKNSRRNV